MSLRIDTGRLDIELRDIPQAIHDAGVRLANAKAAAEAASNAYKLLLAQKSAEVRASPMAFGLPEKATVGAIDGATLELPEVQDALDMLQQANHAVELCWAVVNGTQAKRDALPQLVKLFLNDYYSAPQPHEQEAAEAASEKVATKEKAAKQVADKPPAKPKKKAPKSGDAFEEARREDLNEYDPDGDWGNS